MVTIQTERLVLREFDETDWQAVHSYASDSEVVRYIDWAPNTKDETRAFVSLSISSQKEKPRRKYTLAITLKEENKLIGSCDICVTSSENKEGRLEYCLNRHFWGQGNATETAKALLKFGVQSLNLHRIFAKCDPANIASARVLEKIGMQLEGRLREHKWTKGKWRDSLLYAILEWKTSKISSRV